VGRDLERELVAADGYEFVKCPARPLRKSVFGAIAFFLALAAGLWRGVGVVENFEAEVVIGLGGYASVPGVLAAWILGRKIVLLEQNVLPGRATRFLSRFAREVECQWEESLEYLPRKGQFTGSPVRRAVLSTTREEGIRRLELEDGKKTLLVMGGSQGAEWIDMEMMRGAELFSERARSLQVIHIASATMKDAVEAKYREYGIEARVAAFMRDIGLAYSVADLAVSRAGGMAISELACFGVPMVLVPYPYAAEGHQLLNAQVMERVGAGVVVRQEEGEGVLGKLVAELVWDEVKLLSMRGGALSLGKPEAAQQVARRVADMVEEGR